MRWAAGRAVGRRRPLALSERGTLDRPGLAARSFSWPLARLLARSDRVFADDNGGDRRACAERSAGSSSTFGTGARMLSCLRILLCYSYHSYCVALRSWVHINPTAKRDPKNNWPSMTTWQRRRIAVEADVRKVFEGFSEVQQVRRGTARRPARHSSPSRAARYL